MNKKTDEIKKSGDEDFQAFVDLCSAIMLGEDKRAESVMRKAVKKATKELDNIDIPKGYTIDTERWKQFPQLESGMLVFVSNGCWGKISEDYETGRLYFYRKGGAISLAELLKRAGLEGKEVEIHNVWMCGLFNDFFIHY